MTLHSVARLSACLLRPALGRLCPALPCPVLLYSTLNASLHFLSLRCCQIAIFYCCPGRGVAQGGTGEEAGSCIACVHNAPSTRIFHAPTQFESEIPVPGRPLPTSLLNPRPWLALSIFGHLNVLRCRFTLASLLLCCLRLLSVF